MLYISMSISDESFRAAFKPLHIPAHYQDCGNEQDKVVFALAQLGEGTAEDVAAKIWAIDKTTDVEDFTVVAIEVLDDLYSKGLIKGHQTMDRLHYNLSKITEANDGAVNPNLLAPGLD